MTSDLQRGGHRQHCGPQQQVGHGQVDDEVVGGDPQVSVADHGQDDQNVADDSEQDEECQHHAHRHRPAQVQRGGDVPGADAAVDGRVRRAVKSRRGAVAPRIHGEESPVTPADRARNSRHFARLLAPPVLSVRRSLSLLGVSKPCAPRASHDVHSARAGLCQRELEARGAQQVEVRSDSLWCEGGDYVLAGLVSPLMVQVGNVGELDVNRLMCV